MAAAGWGDDGEAAKADWGGDDGGDGWGDAPAEQDANASGIGSKGAAAGWGDAEGKDMDAPTLQRQGSVVLYDARALQAQQAALIDQTADLLAVTPEEASCLLRHYGWKNDLLQTEWFADQNKVRDKCGVSRVPERPLPTRGACMSAFCEEDVEGVALNCGHFFCNDCWAQYLNSKVQGGRESVYATCMGVRKADGNVKLLRSGCGCTEMVPGKMFERFVVDNKQRERYRQWMLDSFVEGQKKIKWCPRPGCTAAVRYDAGGPRTVKCQCGYLFCFACRREAHVPAPCDVVEKWLKKEVSDDATEIWLKARTKKCPNPACGVLIEKNKACNHMKCAKCGHDFCWLCKGAWSSHGQGSGGYYVCNKYNEAVTRGEISSEEKDMEVNQKVLQKYTYYYKRFRSSVDAISFTAKLKQKLLKEGSARDPQKLMFALDALDKLIEARRVLQWSYAMAYYLRQGRQKELFEYQQNLLIEKTEHLQDIMDEEQDLVSKKKNIIDLISSIEKFRREMVLQIESGAFEGLLLSDADISLSEWACSNCCTENPTNSSLCKGCSACRKHGEMDCRACKKP